MWWLVGAALAAEPAPRAKVSVHGDIKAFTVATFPYDNPAWEALGAWPSDPVAQSTLDGRLKLRLDIGQWRVEAHHAISAVSGGALSLGLGGTGVVTGVPELVDLTWTEPSSGSAGSGGDLVITGRTDRLLVQGELGPVTLALGRQPVSFGSGMFFTPLDLVAPFFPATIDTEYKPGVDAVRVDAYAGTSFQQSVVAAWVGACTPGNSTGCSSVDLSDLVLASWSRVTVGVTDLGLFLGEVRDDEVAGLSVVGAAGSVGLHGDLTLTLPPGHLDGRTPTEDIFVRGVLGADWRPAEKTTLSGEAYLQTNGAGQSADYLGQAMGARYTNGELWALGRSYIGLDWSQELRPTITSNLAVLSNLQDPSALLVPTLSLSVAGNADLSAGAYVGLGKRLDGMSLQSELGLVPVTGFARMAMYF